MQRPLENTSVALSPALENFLISQKCGSWHSRLHLKLYMAARRAFKLPLSDTYFNTRDPYLVFDSLDDIMTRLDLAKITPHLQGDRILRHPPEAPEIDPSQHFAQWAVVWEPVHNGLRAARTLKVDVGAGFCLLSLSFTPLRATSMTADKRMQLDEIMLRHGHDLYDVPAGRTGPGDDDPVDPGHAVQMFAAACATISLIHADYPLAESTLHEATRPVFDYMCAREQEYLRQEEAEERAALTVACGDHPRPQEF